MANELKIYYTSGTKTTDVYSKEPRKSTGGYKTASEVAGNLKSLFGSVSAKMLSEGSTDYRCVFIKNESGGAMSLLKFYFDVNLEAASPDPSVLTPINGEKWIVPTGGIGLWANQDGRLATYVTASLTWTFSFAEFSTFSLGFETGTSVTIPTAGTQVETIDDVYTPPSGITFTEADGSVAAITIGDGTLASNGLLAVWIKRETSAFSFTNDELILDAGAIEEQDDIPMVFAYDY